MEYIDCVVIGAGAVGLACAKSLAEVGREVLIIEQHENIGMETSSRNSEVIHAGIYYPPNSLKATLCLQGKLKLYDYCKARNIPHKQLGKLVLAQNQAEKVKLENIITNAKTNQVTDLQLLSKQDVLELEPDIICDSALFSPSTGIIDSHQFMLALLGDAQNRGADISFHATVVDIAVAGDKLQVRISFNDLPDFILQANTVINAAGLHAVKLANSIKKIPNSAKYTQYYCKGDYFGISGVTNFKHLIYPMHNAAGLGVHLTLDMAGAARFGPDTVWVENLNYDIDPEKARVFQDAVAGFYPGIKNFELMPLYSGIRTKLVKAGMAPHDFVIQTKEQHGITGLVNLLGIESPGLTAALAIGEKVAKYVN